MPVDPHWREKARERMARVRAVTDVVPEPDGDRAALLEELRTWGASGDAMAKASKLPDGDLRGLVHDTRRLRAWEESGV